jgi:hypothetical protein
MVASPRVSFVGKEKCEIENVEWKTNVIKCEIERKYRMKKHCEKIIKIFNKVRKFFENK